MSQIPLNDDIPSNSQKAREEAITQQPQKPEITPFDGEVAGVKRKSGKFWPWMRKMFLSDRKPSEIAMDVLENNIVPGIKDNFRNSIVTGLDSFIYQSAKPSGSSSSNNSISYNNIFRSPTNVQKQPPKENNNNGIDMSNGFSNPCFKTKVEAERFLNDKMKAYNYPTLSVHTLYMMRSQHIDYTWDAYGWTKEEIASWDPNKIIVHINNSEWPWMIDLPQAHVIS